MLGVLNSRALFQKIPLISMQIFTNSKDLEWPRPAMAQRGAWVPNQKLKPGRNGKSTRSQPLDQWSVTRALTLWLYRKEFPQRQKTVKQVKYLLRGKEYNMCGYRHSGRLRRRIFASLNQLRGALLPGFPWPIILICLVHSLYLLHLRTLPEKAMATHSSTLAWKMLWTEESGRLQFMGSLGVRHD